MGLENINPHIKDIAVNNTAKENSKKFSFGKRTVTCYELEYISSDYGTIVLEGEVHSLKNHDMFLRKPGQVVEGFMPYRFQYITFEEKDESLKGFLGHLPDKLNMRRNPRVKVIFDELQALYFRPDDEAKILMKARMIEILFLYHMEGKTVEYNRNIKMAISYIEENYFKDISAEDVAGYAGISVRYLFAQFKTILKDTPVAYLNRLRLEKSKSMLLDTDLSVEEVAKSCGFRSVSYFDYVFKTKVGLSPTQFCRQYILS